MKTIAALLLMTVSIAAQADVVRHARCQPEGVMGKTKAGSLLVCQKGEMEFPAFSSVNVHLLPGQVAQDTSGCLYSVAAGKNGLMLMRMNDDEGRLLCKQ